MVSPRWTPLPPLGLILHISFSCWSLSVCLSSYFKVSFKKYIYIYHILKCSWLPASVCLSSCLCSLLSFAGKFYFGFLVLFKRLCDRRVDIWQLLSHHSVGFMSLLLTFNKRLKSSLLISLKPFPAILTVVIFHLLVFPSQSGSTCN